MDYNLLGAAGEAALILMDPFRLLMLSVGVVLGLVLGIVPGIGGLSAMALLLPFTYSMDSYAALAMLLGMVAVIGTSDTIPAVLFGVPGTAGAQATVMDGHPMAKKGQAGRALAAAYTSSLIGGVVGALLLALTIPILRPVMLYVGSPEMLAMAILGISMVATLSGRAPLRGLVVAALGVLLAMIGTNQQTGILRWTMGTIYLWDGLPLVPMVLGLFAVPEVADMAIKRMAIAGEAKMDTRSGMLDGFRDAIRNWWLVLRCSGLGAAIGTLPGLGSSVIDWIAYGHALQTEKGANKTFGQGDVRGVIAPESANNAITAASLVPTIAFGVPGSAAMAVLLSVFLIHGLVPGPTMLGADLDVTYSMVWSVAIANILGAGLCFLFSSQFARIAQLRYTLVLPAVITFVYLGSFQASRSWGDLYVLFLFAIIGWIMKQLKWPRPPMILGFVLGALIERYMSISFMRYGSDWLSRPLVVTLLALSFLLLFVPMFRHWKGMGGIKGIAGNMSAPQLRWSDLMYVAMIGVIGSMTVTALSWPWGAMIAPATVGLAALTLCTISLVNQVFSRAIILKREASGETLLSHTVHMDTDGGLAAIPPRQIAMRSLAFAGYMLLFMGLIAVIGFLPAIPVFIACYMWLEGRESWTAIVVQTVVMTGIAYVIFDGLLRLLWPQSLLGQWFPALQVIPSV